MKLLKKNPIGKSLDICKSGSFSTLSVRSDCTFTKCHSVFKKKLGSVLIEAYRWNLTWISFGLSYVRSE